MRALDDVIAMHTMRFHDEVVEADELDIAKPSKKPTKREVEMATKLVDTLDEKFDADAYEDTYRDAVLALIKRKAKGEEIDLDRPGGARARRRPDGGARGEPRGEQLMARPLWSGSLSFGLVNVPVQLFSAARDLDFHFHQLHEKDKRRIEQRRFCKEEDVEVGWEEIAHSYDLNGKQVVVTDEELGSVEPRKTRTIEIESFADLAEVDPIYFDHPYFLVPAGEADGTIRAYRLLVERDGEVARRSRSGGS